MLFTLSGLNVLRRDSIFLAAIFHLQHNKSSTITI